MTEKVRKQSKKILTKQKHVARVIHNESKYVHSKPLMRNMNALNVYEIKIFEISRFMHKHSSGQIQNIF